MKQSNDKNTFHHLREAYAAFRKKNYTNAVIILEQIKDSGYDDHYGLFLQAVCLLYSNNFQAAGNVMEKIQRINPSFVPFIQLKTFLALKSSSSRESAIAAYISALEKNSSDKYLRKGLRCVEESKDFYRYQKQAKISDLVQIPAPGKISGTVSFLPETRGFLRRKDLKRGKRKIISINPAYAAIILSVIVIIAVLTTLYIKSAEFTLLSRTGVVKLDSESIEKIDMVDLGGSGYGIINRINQEKTPEFYTSGDMLLRDFNEARALMKKGLFNKAIVILNRIENSNASFPVKEKCDFLTGFIMQSDEKNYEELEIKQINQKPYLYRGSAVKFTGKAVNVKDIKGGTAFSVMVGFDGNNFKGICDVYDTSEGIIDNGDIVEVKGMYILNIGKSVDPYISADKVTVLTKNKG